jgi:acetyl esterase/lipase
VRGLVTRMRVIDEADFAAETSALLERMGGGPGLSDLAAVLAMRSRNADPAVAGRADPAVTSADLYLPARGGPVLARLYVRRGATGPRPVLLWLHGGGFVLSAGDHAIELIAAELRQVREMAPATVPA